MDDKIWFKINLQNLQKSNLRKELYVVQLDKNNYSHWIPAIKQSIHNFNCEHNWNDMWSIEDATIRFNSNNHLYLLMDDNEPLGHMWIANDYLYNVFVSNKRQNGDSVNFLLKVLGSSKKINKGGSIYLYSDSWNMRAINFFKKVGATKLNRLCSITEKSLFQFKK
jgi:hypothetical protein